ncbi:ribonuclease R [Candidatus Nitrosacidococcus sp. I8]|uniref:ribonuclease R n=1 Tax=Candidatus Nitrosacidococcus sp. I8 TaxID=2942908 RepID=UPI002227D321|nr:ribonuclease R [Candidatus Nitrosacidococcus sp. I8]CAH9015076.1 Ribonuclease R [Candidatus Nitrosacidococcus sp. I8]
MDKWKKEDPYFTRECQKYGQPIPSREYIIECLKHQNKPITSRDLIKNLGLKDNKSQKAFYRRLKAMVREGQISRNHHRAYSIVSQPKLISGQIIGHRDGYGFLAPDEGGEDLYLSIQEMRSVLHGDRVIARVIGIDKRDRKEGSIVEILRHGNKQIVGRFVIEQKQGFLIPSNHRLNQDILIPTKFQKGIKPNQIAVAEITQQPTNKTPPIGKIATILGDYKTPNIEVETAIYNYDLPHYWSKELLKEVKKFKPNISKIEIEKRVDLRTLPLVTIDGEDAQDFDDAVYASQEGKNWRLWVAIADVSQYVPIHSAIDDEAKERGNSVYFPNQVIPMLPEVLSNNLCSLKPQEDRLALVCELEIGPRGGLHNFNFYPGIVKSAARLTYQQVAEMLLKNNLELKKTYHSLLPHLEKMYALYQVLHKARVRRGTIDFEIEESQIIFDKYQKIKNIQLRVRTPIHRLIEEFMILANIAAAHFLKQNKIPSLFRTHEHPAEEKLLDLRKFLGKLGVELLGGNNPQSKDFSQLLHSIQERPDFHLIQTAILRSLKQAVYTSTDSTHFGLALKEYTHFTSPIRRYSDLLVHRGIHHILEKRALQTFPYNKENTLDLGAHCSMTERRADEATRDAINWLKCEYMVNKVGETFNGLITGVTGFGLFVELCDIYIEGLIHISALDKDYFHFDSANYQLVGERTHKTYQLGDKLLVNVAHVNMDERKIDLLLT